MQNLFINQNGSSLSHITSSVSPVDGVTYTNGISDLDAVTLNLFAQSISNNSKITNSTGTVYIDCDELHRKITIGDQITLVLNTIDYKFDIIGFNHDVLEFSTAYKTPTVTNKAGITFQMHGVFATTYPMNSSRTNVGGWRECLMRSSTMALMENYLPPGWKAILKSVNKVSGIGNGSANGTETVSDNCFLLSEIEIFGKNNYSVSGEGTQYAYYKAGNSKIKSYNGVADYWWERSPLSGASGDYCRVLKSGIASDTSAAEFHGVSFAFCI